MSAGNGRRPMSLRLSITDRCNFGCKYCVPDEGMADSRPGKPAALHALADAVIWLRRRFNVTTVKVTGGEPLLHPGVLDLVRRVARLTGIQEVALITNGMFLARCAAALKEAGLRRITVSLDTLDPERFARLSRGGRLQDTLAGIEAAVEAGLDPIKLNAVLLRSTWKHDVPDLLDYAASIEREIRFIELMRTGTDAAWAAGEYVPARRVQAWIAERTSLRPVHTSATTPARRTRIVWNGRRLLVGWIAPVSDAFCHACNRLRLDARGRLRRCLMDKASVPLVSWLADKPDYEVRERVRMFLAGKRPAEAMDTVTPMVVLGG